jgi:ATP-dependent DNA helicase DinG
LEQKGYNPFYHYSVPQAVIKFRQGIGRLIRTHQDKGVVLVLDDRIYSKNYGKYFIQSLPACQVIKAPRTEILEKIRQWFRNGTARQDSRVILSIDPDHFQ